MHLIPPPVLASAAGGFPGTPLVVLKSTEDGFPCAQHVLQPPP